MNLYPSFYRQIRETANAVFPSLSEISEPAWDRLISPYTINLNKQTLGVVEKAVATLFQLSRRPSYRQHLGFGKKFEPTPFVNESVLMAYDFHTTADGRAQLVEINTNASSFLLVALLNAVHDGQDILQSPAILALKSSFEQEWQSAGRSGSPSVAIVDDDLKSQKMFFEFLMYRDLFRHWGWQAQVGEASDLQFADGLLLAGQKIDLVYNRSTDFYLDHEQHGALRQAWQTGASVITPQPREYFLLSDKERLIDFGKTNWLTEAGVTETEAATVQPILIPTYDIHSFTNTDELWSKRKTLFFKPKRAYGGKSAYRGESVSRKVFDRLIKEDTLVQKFVPAAPYPVSDPSDSMSHWKYDVRFYVYRDRIQQVAARLYQGQVTNFATPLGGFSQIRFV